jgi:hypothetical protein
MILKTLFIRNTFLAGIFFLFCCNQDAITQSKSNPVSISGTIWGASSAGFTGENISGIESWKRLNERLKAKNGGYGMRGRRSYDTGIPSNFSSSAMASDLGNCPVSLGSFKPSWIETVNGGNNEVIKNFIQSIPGDQIVYLTFYHEPEDNVTSQSTTDVLLRAFARYVEIVLSAGKPNVHPCFVLMTWTFNPKSGRNPDDFNMAKYLKPEQIKEVIAGLDGYAEDPSVSAQKVFETGFSKMKTWGFTRFGIFETGAHSSSDPNARSTWVISLGKWVKSRNDIELVSWFNNGNGQHAGPTGWYLGNWYKNDQTYSWDDADGTIEAFSQLLKQE